MREMLINTTTYDISDGYRADLVLKTENYAVLYEIWLWKSDLNVKELIEEGPMIEHGMPVKLDSVIDKIRDHQNEYKAVFDKRIAK